MTKQKQVEAVEDFQTKEKKKRSVRAAKREKANQEQQAGKTLKEQEIMAQTQHLIRDQLCLHADAQFFGFKP